MPIRNNKVYCVNHQDTRLIRNAGFNALITVDRTEVGTTFDPKSGVPVIAYSCPICGYIEMYAAQKNESWTEAIKPQRTHEIFEDEIIEAIEAENSPFRPIKVSRNVSFAIKNKPIEIDAIVFSKPVTYVIEIKQTDSLAILERAAARMKDIRNFLIHDINTITNPYSSVYVSMVITFDKPNIPTYLRGVPIIKYNRNTKSFVDTDKYPELSVNSGFYTNFFDNNTE